MKTDIVETDIKVLIIFPRIKGMLLLNNPPELKSFAVDASNDYAAWANLGWRERLAFWLLGLKAKGK